MQSLGTPKWSPEKNTYNFVVFELWASEKKSVITTFSVYFKDWFTMLLRWLSVEKKDVNTKPSPAVTFGD